MGCQLPYWSKTTSSCQWIMFEFLPIISGVPQGSVLGPLLFIIYINEVAQLPLTAESKLAMYADDILLYRPVRSTADLICLQEDTTSLGLWANSVNLRFNPRKCKAMILSRRKHVATPSPLLLNGQPVDFVDSIRYLGLTISADLSWSKHIKNITSKARQLVGLLFRQFYKYASTDTIRKLYLTIVRPHLEYACEIWDPYLAKDCHMIESVQKFASRVCLKQWSRNTRYQDMLEFLNMPSLATCRRQRKLCTLYKIVNNLSEYPSPPLIPRNPYYLSRSVHCLSFVRPYAHTNQYFLFLFFHTLFPYGIISLMM